MDAVVTGADKAPPRDAIFRGNSLKGRRQILDLDDFECAAKPKLPDAIYGYVAHDAETEATLRANRAAFDAWRLLTRVLAGVEVRRQDVQLFGRRYNAPFGIAPMGGSALVAYEGHTVMARAAADAGIPFVLSANSIIPLEEVAKANPNMWFAAYQSPDRLRSKAWWTGCLARTWPRHSLLRRSNRFQPGG
jgi:L-lactate dehydrogenase (cytochrome)